MARPNTNGGKQRVGARAWAPDVGGRPAGLLLPDGIADAPWLGSVELDEVLPQPAASSAPVTMTTAKRRIRLGANEDLLRTYKLYRPASMVPEPHTWRSG